MREPKFTFSKILLNGKPEDEKTFLSINRKGKLALSEATVRKYSLENKMVEFLYDPAKRALGLNILSEYMSRDKWSKTMRMFKRQGKTEKNYGTVQTLITRILNGINYDVSKMKEKTIKLEVDEFEDGFLGKKILFVRLPKLEK